MKTIKVRITLYNDFSSTPHELAYALFDEFRTIDVTDEQYAYLLETEFAEDCGESDDFKLLRQDFQLIHSRLVGPFFSYLRRLYAECGFSDDEAERQMFGIESRVAHVTEESDVPDAITGDDLSTDDGLLLRHQPEGVTIVRCLDRHRESVDCEWAVGIEERAFEGCSFLQSVRLPNCRAVGPYAFSDCTSLHCVELGDELREIPDNAFVCCVMLREFRVPRSVGVIHRNAFFGCVNLCRIVLADGTVIVPEDILDPDGNELADYTCPLHSQAFIYEGAFSHTPLDFICSNPTYGYPFECFIADYREENETAEDVNRDGLTYVDVFRKIPTLLDKGEYLEAETLLRAMGDCCVERHLEHASMIVVRIPRYTTASGSAIDYLALVRQDDKPAAYFTIENADGLHYIEQISTRRHSSIGQSWRSDEPTMVMVADHLEDILEG